MHKKRQWHCVSSQDSGGEYLGQHIVQNSSAFAFVSVKDVSDQDPQFIGLPYMPRVKEHSELVSAANPVQMKGSIPLEKLPNLINVNFRIWWLKRILI